MPSSRSITSTVVLAAAIMSQMAASPASAAGTRTDPAAAAGSDRSVVNVSRNAGEDHPIIGRWQWTRTENSCTEVFDFKTDGTVSVVSGKERTDNTFTISRLPDADGFHAMTMTITKDHGGMDCADTQTDDTGHVSTSAVLFDPAKEMYLSCKTASLSACYGPLRRLLK